MSDFRKDPIVGRWVIIAPDRAKRPEAIKDRSVLDPDAYDPFLEGNEESTPSEILAYRDPDSKPNGPGWRVRVFPNKYPALHIEGELEKRGMECTM